MIAYIPDASKSDPSMTVQDLTLACEPLAPEDPIAGALERLRSQPIPALPVVAAGRVVGIVAEADLARALESATDPEALRTATAAQVARREVISLDARMGVEEAARFFAESGFKAAPVLDPFGAYAGMLRRSDVMAAYLGAQMPPPRSIGGMATPLGVRLVCGRVSAGAGPAGLLLTGAAMSLLYLVAMGIVQLALYLVESQWPQWPLFTMLIAGGSHVNQVYFPNLEAWSLAASLVYLLGFLLLMRLAPLSATHGAEHKVVHAIEHGRPLSLEGVRPMSPVHPRCGTNLAAVIFVFVTGVIVFSEFLPPLAVTLGWVGVALALIAWILAMRVARSRLGAWAQAWFTTREPSDRRLSAAIGVGEELLRRYREQPQVRFRLAGRLWMLGLPQVFLGFVATLIIVYYLAHLLHLGVGF